MTHTNFRRPTLAVVLLAVVSVASCFGCSTDKAENIGAASGSDVPSDTSLEVADGGAGDVGVDASMDVVMDAAINLDTATTDSAGDAKIAPPTDTGPPGCQIMTVEAIDAASGCKLGSSILGCFVPDFNGAMGCLKSNDGKVIFSLGTTSIIPSLIASGAYIACDVHDQKRLLDTKICAGDDAMGDTSALPDVLPAG